MEHPGRRGRLYADRQKVIQELGRGLDITHRLRASVNLGEGSIAAITHHHQDLTDEISDSINKALSILSTVHFNHTITSQSKNDWKSVKSSQAKHRRRRYKHSLRNQGSLEDKLVRDDLETPFDDGYSWRKYGQKKILNTKHPREYFKCALNDETACPARKQVQRIQDAPPVYRTIYFCCHTCHKYSLEASFLISSPDVADNDGSYSSNVLWFDKFPEHQNDAAISCRSIKQWKNQGICSRAAISENHFSACHELGFSPLTIVESNAGTIEVAGEAVLPASPDHFDFSFMF